MQAPLSDEEEEDNRRMEAEVAHYLSEDTSRKQLSLQ
jgi:hypothetical protein